MNGSLDQLRELLILTHTPVGTGTPEDWTAAEQRLGNRFPADYRDFVSTYGHCSIAAELFILNPFDDGFWSEIDRERAVQREFPTVCQPADPRVSIPRPEGMIPWGSTGDGGSCFWVPDGDPDTWTVFEEWEVSGDHFAGGMAAFLLASFRGEHASLALGTPFPPSLPAAVEPVGSVVGVRIEFTPTKTSDEQMAEILLRVVPNAVANGVNRLTTGPGGPRLSWWPHSFSMAVSVDDVTRGKELAVQIASALGVRIRSVSEASWAELVGRGG